MISHLFPQTVIRGLVRITSEYRSVVTRSRDIMNSGTSFHREQPVRVFVMEFIEMSLPNERTARFS